MDRGNAACVEQVGFEDGRSELNIWPTGLSRVGSERLPDSLARYAAVNSLRKAAHGVDVTVVHKWVGSDKTDREHRRDGNEYRSHFAA